MYLFAELKEAAITDPEAAKLVASLTEAQVESWLREPCGKKTHRGVVNVTVNQFCTILSAAADLVPLLELEDYWQLIHEGKVLFAATSFT